MGLFFEVECTKCGYRANLVDGPCGYEHLDEIRIKQEFESGKGDPFPRKMFELLRSTVSKDESSGETYLFDDLEPGSKEWEDKRLLYGQPYIRLNPTIYHCYDCESLFNHQKMSIVCNSGIFTEKNVECPKCKSHLTKSVPAEDFFQDKGEPESGNPYICKKRCPKCFDKMKVISSGIAG